jgi:hypothetical protein
MDAQLGDVVTQFWDVVDHFRDVVAQVVKATRLHQTSTQQFRVRSRLPPQWGGRNPRFK